MRKTRKVLFVLREGTAYGFKSPFRKMSGLWNSVRFIVNALDAVGLNVVMEVVQDANSIDRVVTQHRPDICILEAIWCTPDKIKELKGIHKSVDWCVRIHSNVPFVAMEGVAIDWLIQYAALGVKVLVNSEPMYSNLLSFIPKTKLFYLPNIYRERFYDFEKKDHSKYIVKVGCFGAIRPLKNTLIQAMAAIEFARRQKKDLMFFVNSTRVEQKGEPVLKNLRALFDKTPGTKLMEIEWLEHSDFIGVLRGLDMGMQVSLSETFSIVSADCVSAGIPLVCSDQVPWASSKSIADGSCICDIVDKMEHAYMNASLVRHNQKLLNKYSDCAESIWRKFLSGR